MVGKKVFMGLVAGAGTATASVAECKALFTSGRGKSECACNKFSKEHVIDKIGPKGGSGKITTPASSIRRLRKKTRHHDKSGDSDSEPRDTTHLAFWCMRIMDENEAKCGDTNLEDLVNGVRRDLGLPDGSLDVYGNGVECDVGGIAQGLRLTLGAFALVVLRIVF